MTFRLPITRLPSMLLVCIFFPGTGLAQVPVADPVPTGAGNTPLHSHKKFIPTPPPNWSYYGLSGGPELTADYPFVGWPGYRGAFGSFFTNGPRLSQTPVPVYTPIPTYTDDWDPHLLNKHKRLGLGLFYYGWYGTYAASPRPKSMGLNVWGPTDPRAYGKHEAYQSGRTATGLRSGASGYLTVAVKVPQPSAEVYVEGVKTAQTGTDRVFESPELATANEIHYELTARWIEDGVTVERKKTATGKPGEIVTVDFTTEK